MTNRAIDLSRAREQRAQWEHKRRMWLIEAANRERNAKAGPNKYFGTRMRMAHEATQEARKYRALIAELDAIMRGTNA